jgi:hypothetical protein
VFAGADEISAVIGAGAGISPFIQRVNLDAIRVTGQRRDLEQTEERMVALIDDFGDLLSRALLAAFDLGLDIAGHEGPPVSTTVLNYTPPAPRCQV